MEAPELIEWFLDAATARPSKKARLHLLKPATLKPACGNRAKAPMVPVFGVGLCEAAGTKRPLCDHCFAELSVVQRDNSTDAVEKASA